MTRSLTLNSAANKAAFKRESTDGRIRGLSQIVRAKTEKKSNDAFTVGGSAKPKLRTTEHNIRQEKEDALAYINEEIKRYDQT